MLTITINNKKFKVKSMICDKDKSEGMMSKKFDKEYNGMLFLMSNGPHCFWMKNCIIPLDIIFLKNGIIEKIHHNCLPCDTDDCENFCGLGDCILELQGGYCKKHGLKEGDSVLF